MGRIKLVEGVRVQQLTVSGGEGVEAVGRKGSYYSVGIHREHRGTCASHRW